MKIRLDGISSMWPMLEYLVTNIMQDLVNQFLRYNLDVTVMKLTYRKDVA